MDAPRRHDGATVGGQVDVLDLPPEDTEVEPQPDRWEEDGDRHREADRMPGGWSFGTALKTRAVTLGTVAVLAIGPAAAVTSWVARDDAGVGAPVGEVAATAERTAQDSSLAGGVATRLMWAWLTATADDGSAALAGLVAGGVDSDVIGRLPREAPDPPHAVIVQSVTSAGEAVWQVRLSVVDSDRKVTTYLVPVLVRDGQGTVLTLPAQVPSVEDAGHTPMDRTDVSGDGPLTETVAGFATALLTGGAPADVSRWTAPTTTIPPLSGKPWDSVDVESVQLINTSSVPQPRDGVTVDVVATLAAARGGTAPTAASDEDVSTADGESVTLQYTLRLAARDGRWEVEAITAPSLSAQSGEDE